MKRVKYMHVTICETLRVFIFSETYTPKKTCCVKLFNKPFLD